MINIITALPCEAKPLIEHFQLVRHHPDGSFPIYSGKDCSLVISGNGKIAAAAATAWLAAQQDDGQRAWLNVGIGGHANAALGDSRLSHCITDVATQQHWYPTLVFTPPCATDTIFTVDQEENQYPKNGVYEMEASGFYASALRFATSEIVHSYKIISDNPESPTNTISAKQVKFWVQQKIEEIETIVGNLRALTNELRNTHSDPLNYLNLLRTWHFTATEKIELKRLLQRWQAFHGDIDILSEIGLADRKTNKGSDVLKQIRHIVDNIKVTYL